MKFLESLSKMSVVYSELENFSHRPHDAVGDFYLFVQIIEKSLTRRTPKYVCHPSTSQNQYNMFLKFLLLQ